MQGHITIFNMPSPGKFSERRRFLSKDLEEVRESLTYLSGNYSQAEK
jgi:hypothetical protein